MMNDSLRPDVVTLGTGLDLVSPKIQTVKGSIIDGLNYEVVDLSGYKRIDGYTRYDGHVAPTATAWFEISMAAFVGTLSSSFPDGSYISVGADTYPFGVVVDVNDTTKTIKYIRIDVDREPVAGEDVRVTGGGSLSFDPDADPVDGTLGLTAEQVVDNLNTYNAILRTAITPMRDIPVGMHWFRDRLYAICDEQVKTFNSGSDEIFPNDRITIAGATYQVIDIDVTSGTWAGGDAAGDLLLYRISGTDQTSGQIDISRPSTGSVTNAATLTGDSTTPAWYAGIWRSKTEAQAVDLGGVATDAGWEHQDTGWIVEYEDGGITGGAFPYLDRNSETVNTDFDSGTTLDTGTDGDTTTAELSFSFSGDPTKNSNASVNAYIPTTTYASDPTKFVEAVTDADPTSYISFSFRTNTDGRDGLGATNRVGFYNFLGVNTIPEYARIDGVTVTLTEVQATRYTQGTVYVQLYDTTTGTPLGTAKEVLIENNTNVLVTISATEVLGSATDMWGATEIDTGKVLSGQIGVAFIAELGAIDDGNPNLLQTREIRIEEMKVQWSWTAQFTKYYFWDGVDDVKADLIYYRNTSGNLNTNTGVGIMQITNLEEHTGAVRRHINVGDEIHVDAGGAPGTKVAVVTAVYRNAPASLDQVVSANSRYQFVTANFYANEDYDAIYGVSGAGRAFSFDGNYYVTIFTQDDDTKDKPRHIAFYHYHLALGFSSGSVLLSVVGEPENFDGLEGASEIGIGDKVFGLLTMRGTQLGVFCENSIWSITGTSVDNFSTSVIAPATGALEYTVLDVGIPVYCDARGISTLAQSEKYGDFLGSRMSQSVTPWLTKRLIKNKNLFSVSNGAGIACAIPVRAKNQYRVFFRDGYVLTMTLNNVDGVPSFTFQKYYIHQTATTETGKFIVPLAWSSQVDTDGKERIHFSHYSPLSEVTSCNCVYEMDEGWSFNGNFIPAYFTVNWSWIENPFEFNTLRKIRMDGLSHGLANIRISTAKDYDLDFGSFPQRIELPRNGADTFYQDLYPSTNIANVAERGQTIAIKVENYQPADRSDITDAEPSHICQVLLLQFTGGKQDV